MSPRAACRLEAIGFEQVYDYTLGIADWKAAGLPTEGEQPEVQMASDATRADVPTALPHEHLGAVSERASSAGWDEALVVASSGIVVGRLRKSAWQHDPAVRVDEIMELGPTTVRPDTMLDSLVKRMQKRGTDLVVVATPQGVLLGALLREDAERVLTGEAPELIWADCDGCPGQWKPLPRP